MKYLPTLAMQQQGLYEALIEGQLKLQSGQWIRFGEGPRSRFHKVLRNDRGVVISVRAYHGSSSGEAGKKYLQSRRIEKLREKYRKTRTNEDKQAFIEAIKGESK